MANAPERVWVHYAPHISEDEMGATIVGWEEEQAAPAAEYVRADLYEELRSALEIIASGQLSGAQLLSYPPKDPAVECAKGALSKAKDQDMNDNHKDTTEDHAAAYAAGQKEGMSMGYVEGYNSGLADGQKEGLTMGLIEGYNDAKKAE